MNEDVCMGCPDNPSHPWGDWINGMEPNKETNDK